MKLSASLYAHSSQEILTSVKELEAYYVDYWHIDSIENLAVFQDIAIIKQVSQVPIDLHVITKNPSLYYDEIERLAVDRVSFQIEELTDDFVLPEFKQTQLGLAIQISNPKLMNLISKFENQIDFVLIMMTTPGISGGQFDQKYFDTIRELVLKFPNLHLCIDGGVNHEIAYILRLLGVQSIVIGSYLMNHENMAQAILNIRSKRVKSDYQISDFHIPVIELPTVQISDDIQTMLERMDQYKLGLVFVLNEDQSLNGIISNADIRRVLISGDFSYNLSIKRFVNSNPKTIYAYQSTAEMIDYIDKINFPILVLPTLSKDGTLEGAISFHKLLKEE